MIKLFKYCAAILYSTIAQRTVFDMFGDTYLVYGNVVKVIRKGS